MISYKGNFKVDHRQLWHSDNKRTHTKSKHCDCYHKRIVRRVTVLFQVTSIKLRGIRDILAPFTMKTTNFQK